MKFIASFEPQVWVSENAVPAGDAVEWDCTAFIFAYLRRQDGPAGDKPPTVASDPYFGQEFFRQVSLGYFLDRSDVLRDDPAAPSLVSQWDGPFTITVCLGDDDG